MTVSISSWAWIEYLRGSRFGCKAREHVEGEEDAVISTINSAEVCRWFLKFYDEVPAEQGRLTMMARCTVMPVDEPIAVEAARIGHSQRQGRGDSIVVATARRLEAKIVSGDPELRNVSDVICIGKRD